jgi:pimeloyl-ACP methyl ester carboxylesterase
MTPALRTRARKASSDCSAHKEDFVTANGIRLQYLEWGGSGPTLIMIHGGMDNPHAFDDLAPAFADRFRVIAYARRSHGRSEVKGPYDTRTLVEDLVGLMDALRIDKAHLAGWSMGGNEVTGMAIQHPERVDRIVYLDGAFDCADPAFLAAFKSVPERFLITPASAMTSFAAYRSYYQAEILAPLKDMERVEGYLRETVVVQPDGSLKVRMPETVQQEIFRDILADPPRQYALVRCPALAIFPQSQFNLHGADVQRRQEALSCERTYMVPMREKFMEQLRRELAGVEIVSVPGAHSDFFLNSREQVVKAMRRFLSEST